MIRYGVSFIFIVTQIVDSLQSSKYISSSDIRCTSFINLVFIIIIVWVDDGDEEFNIEYPDKLGCFLFVGEVSLAERSSKT